MYYNIPTLLMVVDNPLLVVMQLKEYIDDTEDFINLKLVSLD